MKVGDLVRLKSGLHHGRVLVRDGVGLVVDFEGDSQKGWDVFCKILWGSFTTWESVANLEVIK